MLGDVAYTQNSFCRFLIFVYIHLTSCNWNYWLANIRQWKHKALKSRNITYTCFYCMLSSAVMTIKPTTHSCLHSSSYASKNVNTFVLQLFNDVFKDEYYFKLQWYHIDQGLYSCYYITDIHNFVWFCGIQIYVFPSGMP